MLLTPKKAPEAHLNTRRVLNIFLRAASRRAWDSGFSGNFFQFGPTKHIYKHKIQTAGLIALPTLGRPSQTSISEYKGN